MKDKMLNLKEAANFIGISYPIAYKLARSGELPFIQLGSMWMISLSQLCKALHMEMPAYQEKEVMYEN